MGKAQASTNATPADKSVAPPAPEGGKDRQPRGNAFAQEQLAAAKGGGGKKIKVEFLAFIPKSLGKPFKDTPAGKQTGFTNQKAFEAQAASVSGTWAREPGQMWTDEGASYFATDDRGFGGGSHRLRATLELDSADIGKAGVGTGFKADCNASHQASVDVDGWIDKTAKVVTSTKTAPATNASEAPAATGPDTTVVSHESAASYPFSSMAPNIDLSGTWTFTRDASGTVQMTASGEHNAFPYYEILVNGQSAYKFSSTDTGPGLINLNTGQAWNAKAKV